MPSDKQWEKTAASHLLGRKIVKVRYLMASEARDLGWHERAVVIELDDGSLFWPSRDDEGNGAGALFGQSAKGESVTLPVIALPFKP